VQFAIASEAGMVAWFNYGCLLDQAQGPASMLDEYFGQST